MKGIERALPSDQFRLKLHHGIQQGRTAFTSISTAFGRVMGNQHIGLAWDLVEIRISSVARPKEIRPKERHRRPVTMCQLEAGLPQECGVGQHLSGPRVPSRIGFLSAFFNNMNIGCQSPLVP